VKPVLEAKCVVCHQRGVLPFFSLENRALAFAGGRGAGRIVPGQPGKSRLLMHAHGATPGVKTMPPVGDRLTPDEKRILNAWIAQGAEWPPGRAGELDTNAVYQR
jgi:cytochrome c5